MKLPAERDRPRIFADICDGKRERKCLRAGDGRRARRLGDAMRLDLRYAFGRGRLARLGRVWKAAAGDQIGECCVDTFWLHDEPTPVVRDVDSGLAAVRPLEELAVGERAGGRI